MSIWRPRARGHVPRGFPRVALPLAAAAVLIVGGWPERHVKIEARGSVGAEALTLHEGSGSVGAEAPTLQAGSQKAAAAASSSRFDAGRAFEHIRQLVAIGPRPAGSPGSAQARRYILTQLERAGLKPTEQRFDAATPFGTVAMANVSVVIPGASPQRIILGGHYDTKLFRQFRFVGANDGGSSTAMLLELARVLQARRSAFTIEIVFFDGEEAFGEWMGDDHTYGSRHYVEQARKAGTLANVRAMVLVDMVGDRNLRILREEASTGWLTDTIWAAARRLDHGDVFVDERIPIEDDHVPFLRAGVPAVDIIDLDYAPWHTAGDTLDQVSARSLQIVGDVVLASLPGIEKRLKATR